MGVLPHPPVPPILGPNSLLTRQTVDWEHFLFQNGHAFFGAIPKSIYATLRDCIEANVGDPAKELLRKEHHVN